MTKTVVERAAKVLSEQIGTPIPWPKMPPEIRGMWCMYTQALADAGILPVWRPIKDAPRDGTEVILGRFSFDKSDEKNGHIAVDWWRSEKEKRGYVGWGQFNMKYWPPTHFIAIIYLADKERIWNIQPTGRR